MPQSIHILVLLLSGALLYFVFKKKASTGKVSTPTRPKKPQLSEKPKMSEENKWLFPKDGFGRMEEGRSERHPIANRKSKEVS